MYDRPTIGEDEIENRFGFHKAAIEGPGAATERHARLRKEFKAFANRLDAMLPHGREKSVAFTELENASMWAHKAVAYHEPVLVEE